LAKTAPSSLPGGERGPFLPTKKSDDRVRIKNNIKSSDLYFYFQLFYFSFVSVCFFFFVFIFFSFISTFARRTPATVSRLNWRLVQYSYEGSGMFTSLQDVLHLGFCFYGRKLALSAIFPKNSHARPFSWFLVKMPNIGYFGNTCPQ
jgi:hypothetical protein